MSANLRVSVEVLDGLRGLLSNVAARTGATKLTVTGTERGTELGQGLYSLADMRAFLALSGEAADAQNAPRWLKRALNPVRHHRWRPDYSFSDLVSLFVVRELRRRGVRIPVIQEAENYLRIKWNVDRPFVSDEIKTDGCGVFVDDELIAGQVESADRHGQQVMREAVRERLTTVKYDDGTAAYWMPASAIRVDPQVQFGDPVIDGTRIPTEAVVNMMAYATHDQIADDLGITVDQVAAAAAFEQRRLAALTN